MIYTCPTTGEACSFAPSTPEETEQKSEMLSRCIPTDTPDISKCGHRILMAAEINALAAVHEGDV